MAKLFLGLLFLLDVFACGAIAQDASSALTGLVTDPSGAAIPNARVVAVPASGQPVTVRTTQNGMYEFKTLPPGTYVLRAFTKGFRPFAKEGVTIETGKPISVNVQLEIAAQNEKVEVQDSGTQLDTAASNNASSVVLKGKDLDALSDDPDELQDELQALAGPSAGPNGGQIYIDGFTGGQLPPKSSIREIRINQNPFSAEYDHLGYGRIEVFTKPGTDQFHGFFLINGNTAGLNARNPYLGDTPEPGYDSQMYTANFSGPLGKKASFFLDFNRRNINELSVINTPALDANFNEIQFTDSVANPRTRTQFSPRLDYQVNVNNTLAVRYQYERETEENAGIGLFSLPSQGVNDFSTEHQVQITDTQIVNASIINETRFRYVREERTTNALDFAPTISVNGAFTGGGVNTGNADEIQDQFEVQNYTSVVHGTHFVKFGARLRATKDILKENAGFNGAFTFNSLTDYQTVQQGLTNGMTTAQIRAGTGAGPTQFSLVTGQPQTTNTYWDLGLYAKDE